MVATLSIYTTELSTAVPSPHRPEKDKGNKKATNKKMNRTTRERERERERERVRTAYGHFNVSLKEVQPSSVLGHVPHSGYTTRVNGSLQIHPVQC